jgi:hypothetical protein
MDNCSTGETTVSMYKLKEAMEKFCSDLLASHHGSLIVLREHVNMEVL